MKSFRLICFSPPGSNLEEFIFILLLLGPPFDELIVLARYFGTPLLSTLRIPAPLSWILSKCFDCPYYQYSSESVIGCRWLSLIAFLHLYFTFVSGLLLFKSVSSICKYSDYCSRVSYPFYDATEGNKLSLLEGKQEKSRYLFCASSLRHFT